MSTLILPPKRKLWTPQRRLELNPDSPFARGLVGCWLMGNRACWKSGKLLDLSPYGNHGTLTNMDPQTDWVHDGERAGLDFDGVDDYVDLPQHVDLAAGSKLSFSRILWCRTAGSGNVDRLWKYASASGTDGLEIRREAWSTIISVARYVNWTTKTLKGPAINDDKWHLVAYTETNSETFTLFVDGVVVDQVTSTATPGTSSLSYDRLGDSGGVGWLGPIGAAIHVNRALSPAEVLQFYHETKDGSYGSIVKSPRTQVFMPAKVSSGVDMPYIVTTRKTDSIVERLELNPDSPFAKGLVGCWLMGSAQHWGSAKLLDLSPYGNHGTLQNMDPQTDWVHDGERAGLDFDNSTSQYVLTSYKHDVADDITIAFWNKVPSQPTNVAAAVNLLSSVGAEVLAPYSDGVLYWDYGGTSGNARVSIAYPRYAEWVHIAVQASASADWQAIFIDGDIAVSSTTSAVPSSTTPLELGRLGGRIHYGAVDNLCTWRRLLSPAEISQLYHETKNGSYGSLVRRRRRRVFSVGVAGGITFNASVLTATATLPGTPVQRNTTIQVNA